MSIEETVAVPARRGRTGRRRVDVVLTGVTTILFLAFLWLITAMPHALSATTIIFMGFALIIYSVVVTWLYQGWVDATDARGPTQ